MNKKRILIMLVVFAVLCLLVYLQVRTWKRFDWHTFARQSAHVNWPYVVLAIALIYVAYAFRAVRWRIFLKPIREIRTVRLLGPQYVGFAALALLGRAGEVIRPYIIARKENLTFSSQIAVWTVERIFDMGAFAILLALSFLSPQLRTVNHFREFRDGAFLLLLLIFLLIAAAVVMRKAGGPIGNVVHRRLDPIAPHIAAKLRDKLAAFSADLEIVRDLRSAAQLTALSIGMWVVVAMAYLCVTHAYAEPKLNSLGPARIVLLMLASMVGSLLQLPAVGGGAQLATIATLQDGFQVAPELAVSCGMLIWAVTFMSVIPAGLLLARREHVSLHAIEEAEEKAAALTQ